MATKEKPTSGGTSRSHTAIAPHSSTSNAPRRARPRKPTFDDDDVTVGNSPKPPRNRRSRRAANQQSKTTDSNSGAKQPPPPTSTPPASGNKKKKTHERKRSSRRHRQPAPIFAPHLPLESLQAGIEAGIYIKSTLRCNPNDRTQGFCTVPGLPHDVFIRGIEAQNRAIEGDQVIIKFLPTTEWYQLGSGGGAAAGKFQNRQQRASPATATAAGRTPSSQQARRQSKSNTRVTPPLESKQQHNEAEAIAAVTGGPELLASPALFPPSASGGELGIVFTTGAMSDSSSNSDGEDSSDCRSDSSLESGELQADDETLATLAALKLSSPPPSLTVADASRFLSCMDGYRATGQVVAISQLSRRRNNIVGVITHGSNGGTHLVPCDPRLPKLMLQTPLAKLATQLLSTPTNSNTAEEAASQENLEQRLQHTMVCAAVTTWEDNSIYPLGSITGVVGECGALEHEVKALLEMEGVKDDDQFTPDVLDCLPATPWTPSVEDGAGRRDLTGTRIFSIDPPTARDLDDALSIEVLGSGSGKKKLLRVGVHIADVAHFVRPGTALDLEASLRSTSTYLPSRVIPMLPRLLCEELCSLNPGTDRFAFSIIWDMTEDGDILKTWVGRSVINSCAKLSYGMVQDMIDGKGTGSSVGHKAPEGVTVYGKHTWQDIYHDSMLLHKVACNLRKRRFDNGALRLDNVKLHFALDQGTGTPNGFEIYQQKEANRLVEEFMLAANITAAKIVSAMFPDRAMLRCHPPPSSHKMDAMVAQLMQVLPAGAPALDVSSAGALQQTLKKLCAYCGEGSPLAEVVTLSCTKPMQCARYFSTGDSPDVNDWRHYALAVPYYTHFTSPIRRYPDVVVHRLLAAAIEKHGHDWTSVTATRSGSSALVDSDDIVVVTELAPCHQEEDLIASHGLYDSEQLRAIAWNANDRKAAAKAVQDGCARLYLAVFLLDNPQLCQGVILNLGGCRFFDVYVPVLGVDVRIHTEDMFKGLTALQTYWDSTYKILVLDRKGGSTGEPDYEGIPCSEKVIESEAANGEFCKMPLPLQLRPFSTVTVLVGAKRSKRGSPAGVCARLWV